MHASVPHTHDCPFAVQHVIMHALTCLDDWHAICDLLLPRRLCLDLLPDADALRSLA